MSAPASAAAGPEDRHHDAGAALRVDGVRKVYGGEIALDGVSFTVDRGEIHGLLGANGAGKSTLVRLICGIEVPDGGTVHLFGRQLPRVGSASAARHAGLAYIQQDRALAPDLSVADNIALATGYPTRAGLIRPQALNELAEAALDRVGLRADVRATVGELTIAHQTLVAIARALAVDARLIVLDEPTANLGAEESAMLHERLRELARAGVSAVLVTHALDEAIGLCQRVSVLRNGQIIVAGQPTGGLDASTLASLIVGRDVSPAATPPSRPRSDDDLVLRISGAVTDNLGPLSLDVAAGQIVGVTGLADSGHLNLGPLLVGELKLSAGSMQIDGASFEPASVREALRRGVSYVPPDRVRDGLALDLTSRENLFLSARGHPGRATASGDRRSRPRWRGGKAEYRLAKATLEAGQVKPPDPEAPVSTLSGGNMQKLLIAKWLLGSAHVLVLSEPTVGVDVGARADIYAAIRQHGRSGAAVLVTSSDFDEIAALCYRAVVLRYGRVVADLEGDELTAEALTTRSSEGRDV
jgi:ABC-type sugar transport system ATPase subunit